MGNDRHCPQPRKTHRVRISAAHPKHVLNAVKWRPKDYRDRLLDPERSDRRQPSQSWKQIRKTVCNLNRRFQVKRRLPNSLA